MNCPATYDLHRFHDDELSPVERERVVSHIETCDACAKALASIESTSKRVRSAPLPVPTGEMMARWRRVGQDRSVRRLAGWMTAAASVVLGVSVYMASSTPAQANTSSSDWEAVALGGELEDASTYQATATWIVNDLSAAPANRSQP